MNPLGIIVMDVDLGLVTMANRYELRTPIVVADVAVHAIGEELSS